MSYPEPQWTPTTILASQIIQVFNLEGNEDLVEAYSHPEMFPIVDVLLEAVDRRSDEMGNEWANAARNLVLSDFIFPALRDTMAVLEEVLNVEDSSSVSPPNSNVSRTDDLTPQNLEVLLAEEDEFGLENIPVIKLSLNNSNSLNLKR